MVSPILYRRYLLVTTDPLAAGAGVTPLSAAVKAMLLSEPNDADERLMQTTIAAGLAPPLPMPLAALTVATGPTETAETPHFSDREQQGVRPTTTPPWTHACRACPDHAARLVRRAAFFCMRMCTGLVSAACTCCMQCQTTQRSTYDICTVW